MRYNVSPPMMYTISSLLQLCSASSSELKVSVPGNDVSLRERTMFLRFGNAPLGSERNVLLPMIIVCPVVSSLKRFRSFGSQYTSLFSKPMALFLAIAAMSAINDFGLKIPDDISIVGITDIEASKYLNPPLTTVKIPEEEIGVIAATTLLSRVKGDSTAVKQIYVPTELIERKSVKPI